MKRLTKKPWFGPKQYVGWGFSPRSWQGWTLTLVFIALILLGMFLLKNFILRIATISVLVVLLIFIAAITGDKPGLATSGK